MRARSEEPARDDEALKARPSSGRWLTSGPRERNGARTDITVANALHLLGLILDDKHEYAKAEPPNLRALAIREKAARARPSGRRPVALQPRVAGQGETGLRQAEALYRRALDIQERALGPDHSGRRDDAQRPGRALQPEGRYDDGDPDQSARAGDSGGTLGPDDAAVALALNNLARATSSKAITPQPSRSSTRVVHLGEGARSGSSGSRVRPRRSGQNPVVRTAISRQPSRSSLRALAIREKPSGPTTRKSARR